MSWIDTNEDHHWTKEALQERAAAILRYTFPDADRLRLKAHAVATGIGFMDAADKSRWEVFVAAQGSLERQVEADWLLAQDLERCFVIEAAALAARLDPQDEAAQAALDALVAAATPEVQALVAERNRYPAEPAPEV